jgi:hypothetical protein
VREKWSTDPQNLHKIVKVLRLEFNAQAEKAEDARRQVESVDGTGVILL